MDRIVRLINPIRNYDWGSRRVIAELLGERVPSARPEAELWIGAHPSAPSRLELPDAPPDLAAAIAADPVSALGAEVAGRFDGELPFLMKVLAADAPLSLQVHPDAEQARRGFEREQAAGVPRDANARSYRDARPKPELLCALTPFEVMVGFREPPAIVDALRSLGVRELDAELGALARDPGPRGLARFFTELHGLASERLTRVLDQASSGAKARADADRALAWLADLGERHPGDVSVLAPLLLHVLELQPGEAIALRPGEVHAYLRGAGIEVMGNSDNVLRGGLTSKHVDLDELQRILVFESRAPRVVPAQRRSETESVYANDVEEFELGVLRLRSGATHEQARMRSLELLLCTEGEGSIRAAGAGEGQRFARGEAWCVPASVGAYRLDGEATVYRVRVPEASDAAITRSKISR